MSSNRTSEPQLMFCHQCQDEWHKDDRGLVCPKCGSDIVEIIEPDTDPRADQAIHDHHDFSEHHHHHHHDHPLHDHNPWAGDAPDPDGGVISHDEWTEPGGTRYIRTTMRSTSPGGAGLPPGMADAFGPLFGSIMRPNMPFPGPPNPRVNADGGTGNRNPFTRGGRLGGTYTVSMRGPGALQFHSTGGLGDNVGIEDLNGIVGHMMGMFGPATEFRARGNQGGGRNNPNGEPLNPMMRLLMDLVPSLSGSHGDAAYTQEAYDRILTMLREQHEGSNAPGPASEAAIEVLPKIKIAKEQLDDEGKADCSICMEPVNIGTEVTELPCKHWFHHECVTSWLKSHDTCPQCRRGITPKEGNQDTPRTTGQTPRYWQVNEGDINALARQASNGSQTRRNSSGPSNSNAQTPRRGSARDPSSTTSNQSSSRNNDNGRHGGVTGFFSGITRRLGGHSDNNGGSRH